MMRRGAVVSAARISPRDARPWHALGLAEVYRELDTSEEGLDPAEAARRLASTGPNQLAAASRTHPLVRFLAQFNNVLIYFLLAAAAAAGLFGHLIDAAVITGADTSGFGTKSKPSDNGRLTNSTGYNYLPRSGGAFLCRNQQELF